MKSKSKGLTNKTKTELISDIRLKDRELSRLRTKRRKKQGAKTFEYVLSMLSIMGFIGIIIQSFAYFDIANYVEFSWIMIMGIGLFIEAGAFSFIKKIRQKGVEGDNFHRLITSTIGFLAIIVGVLTFPMWAIESPGFLAIKGTIAMISALYILIQTWIVK